MSYVNDLIISGKDKCEDDQNLCLAKVGGIQIACKCQEDAICKKARSASGP